MASGKQTPRQKMINMMYLVLTALLALNVSKEILNAFVIMNDGLTDSRMSVEKKNNDILAILTKTAADQPKYAKAAADAQKVKKDADDLIKYVESLKILLINEAEGKESKAIVNGAVNLTLLDKKDDYDTPTRVMVEPPPGLQKGKELKSKLQAYSAALIKYVKPEDQAKWKMALEIDTKDPKNNPDEPEINSWEAKIFHHSPMAAAIAQLAKIQGDIRKVEGEAINYLFSSVDAQSFKFDQLVAIAKPKSGFVFQGGAQEVEIVLGAYDSKQSPTIEVNGRTLGASEIVGGKGLFKTSGSGLGEQTVKGNVIVTAPDGKKQAYPFETNYMVGAPSATISPTKMNVFYIGVENPVRIAVPGVALTSVNPSITGGSITKAAGNGEYIVKVNGTPGSKSVVSVSAKLPDGTTKQMGTMEFRVKRVPDPVAKYLGSKGGPMGLAQVKVGAGINCELENFDFDLKFNITSFTMGANIGGDYKSADCSGPAFSPAAKTILSQLKTGSKVFFDNIKAKGPDGTSRTLAPFFITCK